MRALYYSTFGLTLFLPNVAHAVQTYPAEIQAHLGLSFTPPCTLCHASSNGGLATVVTPFGKSMMGAGLSTNFDSLDVALDRLTASNTDSNGDGSPDVQELKDGNDPDTGKPFATVEQQQFGCGAMIARKPPRSRTSAVLAWAYFALALSRRGRSKHSVVADR